MKTGQAVATIILLVATIPACRSVTQIPTARPGPSLPAFEFRGHRIGEPIPVQCKANSLSLKNQCDDSIISGESVSTRRIGNVPIQVLSYGYYKDVLTDFMMTFHKNFYPQIHNMLIGKYGNPTRETLGKVQSQTGVVFVNVTCEWDFAEGTLKLEMLRSDINTSFLIFDNPTAKAQITSDDAASSQVRGASAF